MRCGRMEVGLLGIGEERIWPPDAGEHLVADAEFILLFREVQTRVVPVLAEVEVKRVILFHSCVTKV